MRLLCSFLGTSLPDVRSKNSAASSEYKMGTSVMGLELVTTIRINRTGRRLSNDVNIIRNLEVDLMKNALADLDNVCDVEDLVEALDGHGSNIMHLTA